VRLVARSCLVAFLIVGLLNLPAIAASDNTIGTVVQSETGRLGNAVAVIGTTVYAGDNLWTETGTLRVKVGSGQMYLLASSAATVARNSDAVQAMVTRGTVGFTTGASERVELFIPEGIVRAASDQPAYGQVTLVGPTEAVISAYRGALILDNAGDLHTIGAGNSYRVKILDDTDAVTPQKPEGEGTEPQIKFYPQKRRRLLITLIVLGAVGVGTYFLEQYTTESPSKPQ
jgi:hypothetical protein